MTLVPSLPFLLEPSPGSTWQAPDADPSALYVVSGPGTEYFVDPGYTDVPDEYTRLDADTLLGPLPDGDFTFSARVEADLRSPYDAGVLLLHVAERTWAKLCLERSPAGIATVVSVVTRELADDANAVDAPADGVWLRIARTGRVVAFHTSADGHAWRMVRVFTFGTVAPGTRIGFLAQSPRGDGCAVRFTDIRYAAQAPQDIRDGA